MITGHVLDCSVRSITRALNDIDQRLYVKWNPKKLKGWGLWEIRFRPEFKVAKASQNPRELPNGMKTPAVQGDIYEMDGYTISVPKYHENNLDNHIMDVPFLNYLAIEKLKSMDTWQHSNRGQHFVADMESKAASFAERKNEIAKQERNYELRQNKTAIRDLMNYTLSGNDPSRIANYWPKS